MRVWKSQEGREIKAALLELKGAELTLRLENGAVSKVALSRLSADDQVFARQAAAPLPGVASAPAVPLAWPPTVAVNPKALDIVVGKQDTANREFHYASGSFHYIAKAPLSGTVMKDVAVDFELARQFVAQLPWGWMPRPKEGMEDFTRKVAYHKGTLKLSKLETSLKAAMAAESRTKPDVKRMIEHLHTPWKGLRNDVKQMRVENYLDGMMLVYYFGFLDGDGKGTRLHEYYRAAAQESLAWRAFREGNGKAARPRSTGTGSYPEWAAELMKIVIAGRTDQQIAGEMVAKFKAMGIKIE